MVNQRLASLILVTLFILGGCASDATPMNTEESATPTNAEIIIPSSTPLPTETTTPIPTETLVSPTPTLYLTPLPTLSLEQERIKFYRFYNFINGCRLPCLWGITPGITTWTEAKQFIEQFNFYNHIEKEKWSVTKSTTFDTYGWYVKHPIPGVDDSSAIFLEVQNNVVTAILIDGVLSDYLFPLDRLLTEYGQPDKILLDTITSKGDIVVYHVDVLLIYEDEHIFSSNRFIELGSTGDINRRVCLWEELYEPMMLWSPGEELNRVFSQSKLLNEFSKLDDTTFHQRFKYKGNKCFEISKDAWN